MKLLFISSFAGALTVFLFAGCQSSTVEPAPSPEKAKIAKEAPAQGNVAAQILAEVNRYRTSNGKAALSSNSLLNGLATDLAETMESTHTVGHAGFAGRASRANSGGFPSIAENAGKLQGSEGPSVVVGKWIASKHHKKNMLGPYNSVGVGTSSRDGQTYVGLILGTSL